MTWRAVLLCALAIVLAATPVCADRATAEFFSERATKSLDEGLVEEAEDFFRRALEEDSSFAPARFGLARALIASERTEVGLEELKLAVDALRGHDEWKAEQRKAEELLDEIDAVGKELREMVDDHADELVKFARKWTRKDPEIAVEALQKALLLRPGHPKAVDMIVALGRSPKGPPVVLFDGSSLDELRDCGTAWQIERGVLVARAEENAYIARSLRSFEGDYDVRMVARLLKIHEEPSLFAFCPAFDGDNARYSFGMLRGKFRFYEKYADGRDDREILDVEPAAGFDPKLWHTYEMRFRGDTVSVYVDGQKVGEDKPRPDDRASGFVGLVVQGVTYEIRRLEVERW